MESAGLESSQKRRFIRGKLWSHPDFLRLWVGQSISELGSQVTLLAMPTVAILVLHASPFQVGVLGALGFLAFPVLGLVAGVWADRLKRRPILVVCDVARALAIASVPIAFLFNAVTLYQLYAVALVTGVATVFFDIAYQSYLPALIERRDLVEGNSKLEITRSVAYGAGPALAGFLIQLFRAAVAMTVDALSFLVSVTSIILIRKPEPLPSPATAAGRAGFRVEVGEGLAVVLRSPILRRIAGCTATSNLGSNMVFAVYFIFTYRVLSLSPGIVGLVLGVSSLGWVVGAMTAFPIARRIGLGPTLLVSITTSGVPFFLLPLARGAAAIPVLVISGLISSSAPPIYNINQVSLRQAITPDRVQGRMNATMRTIVWGTIPVGFFLGGVLGSWIGIVRTILVGAAIATAAAFWVAGGEVVRLRDQPVPVE